LPASGLKRFPLCINREQIGGSVNVSSRLSWLLAASVLFLFSACAVTGETSKPTGAPASVSLFDSGLHVVPLHWHRCPVCSQDWSHRKAECAEPRAYADRKHRP